MKLISFSVTNYRSITSCNKINLSNLTVLIGKNNEGKSNLLKGLNLAMSTIMLSSEKDVLRRRVYLRKRNAYNWLDDFPIQFQDRKKGTESIFNLVFRLENSEKDAFHSLTGIRGNEDIPIRIKFNKENEFKIEIPKRGSSNYNKKSEQITSFISESISVNYIKTIRTESVAIDALFDIVYGELATLEKNAEYVKAQEKIVQLQKDILDEISKTIIEP